MQNTSPLVHSMSKLEIFFPQVVFRLQKYFRRVGKKVEYSVDVKISYLSIYDGFRAVSVLLDMFWRCFLFTEDLVYFFNPVHGTK